MIEEEKEEEVDEGWEEEEEEEDGEKGHSTDFIISEWDFFRIPNS